MFIILDHLLPADEKCCASGHAPKNELEEADACVDCNLYLSVGGLILGLFGEDLGAAPPTVLPLVPPPDGSAISGLAGAAVVGALELL